MGKGYQAAGSRAILTLGVFALVAAAFWLLGPRPGSVPEVQSVSRGSSDLAAVRETALQYAGAVRDGDCARAIALTAWMGERLRNARTAGADVEAVREQLCAELQDRSLEGNRLRPEGVEDRYVFAPGVTIEFVRADAGRSDLSRPVRGRAWLRVEYPAADRALSDQTGRPLKALTVGVNVTREGYVAKAGVVGNLEIDYGSLRYEGSRP